MEQEIELTIIVESPPPGVDYGLQKGGGNEYETIQRQRLKSANLRFDFTVRVRDGKDGQPNFLGPFVHGPTQGRFVYLDIGTCAGQIGTPWSRRLKVPLTGITWQMIKNAKALETRVPGTGKDGSPTCATVKPFAGWNVVK